GWSRSMPSTSPVCRAWVRAELSEIGRTITCASFAFGPQYVGFRARTTFSLTVQLTNLYGPVPVGCWNAYEPDGRNTPFTIEAESASYFFNAVGLCIENDESTSDERKAPFRLFSVMTAVF